MVYKSFLKSRLFSSCHQIHLQLYSITNLSKITTCPNPLILYLLKCVLIFRVVIANIHKKGLHISDTPSYICLGIFNFRRPNRKFHTLTLRPGRPTILRSGRPTILIFTKKRPSYTRFRGLYCSFWGQNRHYSPKYEPLSITNLYNLNLLTRPDPQATTGSNCRLENL